MRSLWIKTNLIGPIKWSTSTLTVLHMKLGYIKCFMDISMFFFYYYYLLYASSCFTNHWHAKVKHRGTTLSFLFRSLIVDLCRTSESIKLRYLRNVRILKFSRKDIIWCFYKKITFNTLYRLIPGNNVWWNWLNINLKFIYHFSFVLHVEEAEGKARPKY